MVYSRYFIARIPTSLNEATDQAGEMLWKIANLLLNGLHRLALSPREYLIPLGFLAAIVTLGIAAKTAKLFLSGWRMQKKYRKARTKLHHAKLDLIIGDRHSAIGLLMLPIVLLALASVALLIYFSLQGSQVSVWQEGRGR